MAKKFVAALAKARWSKTHPGWTVHPRLPPPRSDPDHLVGSTRQISHQSWYFPALPTLDSHSSLTFCHFLDWQGFAFWNSISLQLQRKLILEPSDCMTVPKCQNAGNKATPLRLLVYLHRWCRASTVWIEKNNVNDLPQSSATNSSLSDSRHEKRVTFWLWLPPNPFPSFSRSRYWMHCYIFGCSNSLPTS